MGPTAQVKLLRKMVILSCVVYIAWIRPIDSLLPAVAEPGLYRIQLLFEQGRSQIFSYFCQRKGCQKCTCFKR